MLFSLLLALVLVLVVSILGIVYTNRQKRIVNEQKNQIAKINHALEESIGLKDVLLKEINHRVKNNLSMLSGLMYLKEMDAGNEETVNTLHDMRSRIHTISLIHETLYQNNITVDVDFHEYLLKLSEQIINIYSGSVSSEVRLNVHCKGLALDLSKAISLAMIVNELITNSLKHAFHHTTQPMIHIGYSEETHTFDYFDNGPGFENEEKAGSHGTKLMAIFARQLDATFSYKRENNYLITSLKFNKPIPNSGNL
jgi:two-component sensor histidine kinase